MCVLLAAMVFYSLVTKPDDRDSTCCLFGLD